MSNDKDLHWNPKKRHKMENEKEIEPILTTGQPGDIVELPKSGTTYKVQQDGSWRKLG
jgi:hypothetical protein